MNQNIGYEFQVQNHELKFILCFREVVLGEHDTRTDPDCPKESQGTICAPKKITRKVAEIIKHENFGGNPSAPDNDIALIRLNEPVPLYSEDPFKSAVTPVCLPWSQDNAARDIEVRIF